MNKIKLFLSLILINIIIGCTNQKQNVKQDIQNEETPKLLYAEAMKDINLNEYDGASLKFKDIIFRYPLANEGVQSQIMLGFIDYLKLDYDQAIYKFNKVIKLYPSHKNNDYAYYMIGMSYYEQIKGEKFDGFNNQESLKYFQKILNKFPQSEYAKDSNQKIIFINEIIAAKHMNIAMYYYEQRKYLAALNRYKIVIDDHSKSKFTPEALYRLVEIYSILGINEEAENTASIIAYNYPKSKWYRHAYNLIKRDESKNDKITLKKKLFNLFKKNEVN